MRDLISKDRLLYDFRHTITENSDTFDWLNMISRQPIAFDVDKVIRNLELVSYPMLQNWGIKKKVIDLEDAIKIIKGGGVNE